MNAFQFSDLISFSSLMSTLGTATIVILAGLGCLMTEKAGMMNIGLDGIITGAGFVAAVVSWAADSWALGLLAALATGLILGLFYGVMVIRLKSDEFVIGVTLNMFLIALSTFLYRSLPAEAKGLHVIEGSGMPIPKITLTLGNSSPVSISILVPVALILVAVCQVYLFRTRHGFWLRAAGEHPESLQSVGRSPARMKYVASLACGAFCGLSGAYLLNYVDGFSEGFSASRGYIAVACVIFGRSNPLLVTLAALFFGLVDTVGQRLQVFGIVDSNLTAAFPYAGTILMMVVLAIYSQCRKTKRKTASPQPEAVK